MSARLGWMAFLLTGCLAYTPRPAFDPRFPDNRTDQVRAVLADNKAAKPPVSSPALVVGTTGTTGGAVQAWRLVDGSSAWKVDAHAITRPEILGDTVLFATGKGSTEEVVALDAATGRERWRLGTEARSYLGATRTAETLVLVTSRGVSGGAKRDGKVFAVDVRTGARRWARETEGVLGAPASLGNAIYVPWNRHSIVVLDAQSGIERARIRSTDDVIAWVTATQDAVFYGGHTLYRLTEASGRGTRAAAVHRTVPIVDAPASPMVADDAFLPTPAARSARGRIRFFFAPDGAHATEKTPFAVVDDAFYFVYFRYLFAFGGDGTLRWVRALERPVVGAHVVPGGLLTADEGGTLRLLAASTGNDAWTTKLDTTLASVTLGVGDWSPKADGGAPRDLRRSLNEVAIDADNTLADGRAYAVRLLAARPEADVTRDLLELYAQRSIPGGLRGAIEKAVQGRKIGIDHVVRALDARFDFLEGTSPPPFALVVPAVLANERKDAVPALVRHLFDHETPLEALPGIVGAIHELGGASTVPALREFLERYRADSAFAEEPRALVAAAEAVVDDGGPDGRTLVTAVRTDARTLPGLSTGIQQLFDAERTKELALARSDREAKEAAARDAARLARAALPAYLDQVAINRVFADRVAQLRQCILEELVRNPKLARVRWTFIVEGTGKAHDFTYAPNGAEFVACVAPTVEGTAFPRFRASRQPGAFAISLRTEEAAPADTLPKADPNTPWWVAQRSTFARVDAAGPGKATTPWWIKKRAPVKAKAAKEGDDETPWWVPVE